MSDGNLIYLSLGSNLGDRVANLNGAIAALPGAGVRVLRQSSFYETEPVDFLEQPWFLNCAVEGETSLSPVRLLEALQGIERTFGSKKLVARGPRILDLDILFFGENVIHANGIEIPHPPMANRRFVLQVPMAELRSPGCGHPVLGATQWQNCSPPRRTKASSGPWQPSGDDGRASTR